jgi:hypothetical protein
MNFQYTVMLYKQGTGVVAFETTAKDTTQAVKQAMNQAFAMFPDGNFALHGYTKSDGESTVTTERYLGKI